MVYQCAKCNKVYSKKELIDYLIKTKQVGKLQPICPNCSNKIFRGYEMSKVDNKNYCKGIY